MIFISSFYHLKPRVDFGFISFWLLILIIIVGTSIYGVINFSKYGQFWGKPEHLTVEISELFSFGNFYNRKNVCTKGYFVEGNKLSILKISLNEDRYTRTAWVITGGREIITRIPGAGTRAVLAEICGKFEASRDGEFGEPPVWIIQITVDSYKTFGDPFEVSGNTI